MASDHDRLKTTLDDLHQQLAEVERLDPAQRQQLAAALDDIRAALNVKGVSAAAEASSGESLIERLRDARRDFEESHPALSGTIGSLIDALGRMGI